MEPAHGFSKFKMGMEAMSRKLEALVRPMAVDIEREVDGEADADAETALTGTSNFALTPGTV